MSTENSNNQSEQSTQQQIPTGFNIWYRVTLPNFDQLFSITAIRITSNHLPTMLEIIPLLQDAMAAISTLLFVKFPEVITKNSLTISSVTNYMYLCHFEETYEGNDTQDIDTQDTSNTTVH